MTEVGCSPQGKTNVSHGSPTVGNSIAESGILPRGVHLRHGANYVPGKTGARQDPEDPRQDPEDPRYVWSVFGPKLDNEGCIADEGTPSATQVALFLASNACSSLRCITVGTTASPTSATFSTGASLLHDRKYLDAVRKRPSLVGVDESSSTNHHLMWRDLATVVPARDSRQEAAHRGHQSLLHQ